MKLKSLIAFTLALILTSMISFTSIVYAKSETLSLHTSNDLISEVKSTLPYTGPIDGFIKGKSVSRTKTQNMSTLALAAAAVGKIAGIPAKEVLATYGTLVTVLQASGMSEVYYTRTEYHSSDKQEYYYKSDYYLDQAHNDYAGTAYSYVYTKWY